MKDFLEFDVMLDIYSDIKDVTQLSNILGIDSATISHREVGVKKVRGERVWMIESDCYRDDPLSDHIDSILAKLEGCSPFKINESVQSIYLNIGVFFDINEVWTPSILLSSQKISDLNRHFSDLNISITCYPVNEENGDLSI